MNINIGMGTNLGLNQNLSVTMKVGINVLQKNSQELETAIDDMLKDNFMLEVDDNNPEEDRNPLEKEEDNSSNSEEKENNPLKSEDFDDYNRESLSDGTREDDESFSEVNMMREAPEEEWDRPIKDFGKSLQEVLEDQLGIWKGTPNLLQSLSDCGCDEAHFRNLVRYLIDSLDENGFLTPCDEDKFSKINSQDKYIVEIEKIIQGDLDLKENTVSLPVYEAFHVLHGFTPVGVGARNQRECFLIQANRIPDFPPLGIEILEKCYDDLLELRYARIGKTLGHTTEEIQNTIRAFAKLTPHPGFQVARTPAHTIHVDLKVEEKNGEFEVKAIRSPKSKLRINQAYKALTKLKTTSKKDKEAIRRKTSEAELFINAINNRYSTMELVMKEILKRQKDFFTKGPAFLKPMVLQDIADVIKNNVSTVNRVTNGKFVETPYGIYELKDFFTSGIKQKNSSNSHDTEEILGSAQVIDAIKTLIDNEDKKKPLSDQAISNKLEEMGMKVARRTVAKYRENNLHILTASQRKQ